MSRPALDKEAVLFALRELGHATAHEVAARVGYLKEAARCRLKELRDSGQVHVVSYCKGEARRGSWIPIYAAGSGVDARIPSVEERHFVVSTASRGVPKICRAAFQAMPDNPFRVAMCQVGV